MEVLQSGLRAYARDLLADRGQEMALDVELEATTQRTTAICMLAGSGALVVLGSIASGVAIDAGLEADDIAGEADRERAGADRGGDRRLQRRQGA